MARTATIVCNVCSEAKPVVPERGSPYLSLSDLPMNTELTGWMSLSVVRIVPAQKPVRGSAALEMFDHLKRNESGVAIARLVKPDLTVEDEASISEALEADKDQAREALKQAIASDEAALESWFPQSQLDTQKVTVDVCPGCAIGRPADVWKVVLGSLENTSNRQG